MYISQRTTVVDPCLQRMIDNNLEMQYNSQIYVEAFKQIGIHTSKVTHANRKRALNMMAQEQVSAH